MKIAVAQIDCRLGDVDANVAHINAQIERAGSAACDLVLLPEMADTGYQMDVILEKAAGWESGPVDEIRKQAVKCGIAVCCGLSERVDGHIYNSQALISRDGAIVAHYRKAHLFTASPVQEERLMQAGDALQQFGSTCPTDFRASDLGSQLRDLHRHLRNRRCNALPFLT